MRKRNTSTIYERARYRAKQPGRTLAHDIWRREGAEKEAKEIVQFHIYRAKKLTVEAETQKVKRSQIYHQELQELNWKIRWNYSR